MDLINKYLQGNSLLHSISYLIISLILFYISKLFYKLLNPQINISTELAEKSNVAFIISYVGYFAAVIIILITIISGKSYGFWDKIILISTYTLISMVLLQISIVIINKLILTNFCIKDEILREQNEGSGIIGAAIYLGNAFILYGSLVNTPTSIGIGITTFVIFWTLGNILLVISTKFFSIWTPYDIHKEIEKDNISAGIVYAGAILAISLFITNALINPFTNWGTTIIDIILFTLLGNISLPIVRLVTDKLLLPSKNLTHKIINQNKPNLGAGLIEAFAYVSVAVLIVFAF